MSDSLKMTPFFDNKRFYLKLSLDTFQPTNNHEAHDFAKHMNDILKQLRVNLLMSHGVQRNTANLHQTLAPSYQVKNQV